MFKYADDTNLLPENTDIFFTHKFSHIKSWAASNRMNINLDNNKELLLLALMSAAHKCMKFLFSNVLLGDLLYDSMLR